MLKVNLILFFISNFIFSTCFITNNNLIENNKCLLKLYKFNFDATLIIINTKFKDLLYLKGLKNTRVIFHTKHDLNNIQKIEKMNYFLFLLQNDEEMQTLLENISKYGLWNSRGKFLLYFGEDVKLEQIFKVTWDYNIYNLAIIKDNNIYINFPFKNGSCGTNNNPEIISNCEEIQEIYPEKIPNDLLKCPVRLLAFTLEPFVINTTVSRENAQLAGIEVTIIHAVSQKMNFKEVYLKNPYYVWGSKLPNNSYTHMYGMLQRKETDIIYGFIYANRILDEGFDSTFSHLSDIANWWVPTADKIPDWMNLGKIFSVSLWGATGFLVIFNGITWWLIGRKVEESNNFNQFTLAMLNSWYVLFQSIIEFPKSNLLRPIVFAWCIITLMLYTAYTCQFVSYLTTPLYEKQIDSVEELLDSNLQHGFFPAIGRVFNPKYPLENKILNGFIHCSMQLECEHRMALKKDIGLIANRRTMYYLMPRFWTYPDGRNMIFEIREHEIRACLR